MDTAEIRDDIERKDQIFNQLQYLTDEPAEADEFSARPHDRTSKALLKILTGQSGAVRSIGLAGPWGSGKSTVVEIARKAVSSNTGEDATFRLFTFDLWAHQGDPLRRAFLVTFLNWLKEEELCDQRFLDERLSEVQSKKNVTETEVRPKLTIYGLIGILLTIIFPVALVWLSPLAFSSTVQDFSFFGLGKYELQTISLFILIVPYGMVLLAVFRGGLSLENISQYLAWFDRKETHNKTTKRIREEDPSGVEFGSFFRDVVSHLKSSDERLILVLDNIDRLPAEEISDAWAIMRSLIGRKGDEARQPEVDKVWLIVPFDFAIWSPGLKLRPGPGMVPTTIRSFGSGPRGSSTRHSMLFCGCPRRWFLIGGSIAYSWQTKPSTQH